MEGGSGSAEGEGADGRRKWVPVTPATAMTWSMLWEGGGGEGAFEGGELGGEGADVCGDERYAGRDGNASTGVGSRDVGTETYSCPRDVRE